MKVPRKTWRAPPRDPGRRPLAARPIRAERIGQVSDINYFVSEGAPASGLRRIREAWSVALDVRADDGHEGRASAQVAQPPGLTSPRAPTTL